MRARQVAHVSRNNRLGTTRDREFNQMVVRRIREIGPPTVVNLRPTTNTEENIEYLFTVLRSLVTSYQDASAWC